MKEKEYSDEGIRTDRETKQESPARQSCQTAKDMGRDKSCHPQDAGTASIQAQENPHC